MEKSAEQYTPAQNIHIIDLTVDSLGYVSGNIGSWHEEVFSVNEFSDVSLRNYHADSLLSIFYEFEWQAKAVGG